MRKMLRFWACYAFAARRRRLRGLAVASWVPGHSLGARAVVTLVFLPPIFSWGASDVAFFCGLRRSHRLDDDVHGVVSSSVLAVARGGVRAAGPLLAQGPRAEDAS